MIKPSLCNHAKLTTVLLDFYGHFGCHEIGIEIFNNVNHQKKDKVMIASMMKCLINSKEYEKAINLYGEFWIYTMICCMR